jgi:PHP family Zn ribbon phosphoesterase
MTPNNIARMCMLGGVDIAALTDHNSTLNCPAFFKVCESVGVTPVAGAELCTAEEVHVICLFPALDPAMDFGKYLYTRLPDIKNDPATFGRQVEMNESDEETGDVDRLLITATDISIDDIFETVRSFGGCAVPAHIDRHSFSLLYNLGFIPDSYPFRAYEVRDMSNLDALISDNPTLDGKTIISDSDAHELAALVRDAAEIELPELSAAALVDALS